MKVKKLKTEANESFPNIDEMTITKGIRWYTKQIAEITNKKHRFEGKYSEANKQAL